MTASGSIDSNLPTFRCWNDMLSEACFIYKMKDTTNKPAKKILFSKNNLLNLQRINP